MDFKTAYRMLALALRRPDRPLRVVVVGANDGRLGDPIFPLLKARAADAVAVLIEPHPYLIPILKSNYSFLPGARFSNRAVGARGQTDLYAVHPDYWDRLRPHYAPDGWPPYRAPLGVTSANRQHVERWVRSVGKGQIDPVQAVAAIQVESRSLEDILAEAGLSGPIDILQIDTEGFDDEVIYHSGLDRTKPRMIALEAGHLKDDRRRTLLAFLEPNYECVPVDRDIICVRKDPI